MLREMMHEMAKQEWNLVFSLTQRRCLNRESAQAIIEIFPQVLFGKRPLNVVARQPRFQVDLDRALLPAGGTVIWRHCSSRLWTLAGFGDFCSAELSLFRTVRVCRVWIVWSLWNHPSNPKISVSRISPGNAAQFTFRNLNPERTDSL